MLKEYVCPDCKQVPIDECLNKCRMDKRCAPRSYLRLVSKEREWENVPSVTQLIKGTREMYYQVTADYVVNPQDAFFRLLGTGAHSKLESEGTSPEQTVIWNGISGTPDEVDEDTLWDYKIVGSYKVTLALGIEKQKSEHDKIIRFGRNPSKVDIYEWFLQVNMYRIMLEESKGIYVSQQNVFATVRDASLQIAKTRGVTNNFYVIPIPRVYGKYYIDTHIKDYFNRKRDLLLNHLFNKVTPPLCSSVETWDGRKCQDYCSFNKICKEES